MAKQTMTPTEKEAKIAELRAKIAAMQDQFDQDAKEKNAREKAMRDGQKTLTGLKDDLIKLLL